MYLNAKKFLSSALLILLTVPTQTIATDAKGQPVYDPYAVQRPEAFHQENTEQYQVMMDALRKFKDSNSENRPYFPTIDAVTAFGNAMNKSRVFKNKIATILVNIKENRVPRRIEVLKKGGGVHAELFLFMEDGAWIILLNKTTVVKGRKFSAKVVGKEMIEYIFENGAVIRRYLNNGPVYERLPNGVMIKKNPNNLPWELVKYATPDRQKVNLNTGNPQGKDFLRQFLSPGAGSASSASGQRGGATQSNGSTSSGSTTPRSSSTSSGTTTPRRSR